MNFNKKQIIKFSIIGIIIFLFFMSYTIVPAGYSGVVFNKLTGNMRSSGQGATFKVPFIMTVQSYPVSLRTYTMVLKKGTGEIDDSMDLPTKEGQHIKQDLSVTYNTSPDKASDVFKSFKGANIGEIEKTFIRRTIITSAQNIAGQMSLTELISSDRSKLQDAITKDLTIELEKMGFHLDMVNLGASHLPEAIETQMQQKMAAQQDAQKAEYELQKQQMLAKATVAKAKGEAESLLIKAKAQAEANELLQKTLTDLLVENKKIEKWNGQLPQITGSSIPIINLNKKQ
jgi:regulator of protease activity HflC (stomatin/prohibitin superfamily)